MNIKSYSLLVTLFIKNEFIKTSLTHSLLVHKFPVEVLYCLINVLPPAYFTDKPPIFGLTINQSIRRSFMQIILGESVQTSQS